MANSTKATLPKKPRPDWPLFPHRNGQWCKKIRGKHYFFGVWSDPQAALQKYLDQEDGLVAGRKPRNASQHVTVRRLLNEFLTFKRARVVRGELTQRSWTDYEKTCKRIGSVFGLERAVDDLADDDFAELRADIARVRGPTATATEIIRARSVFGFAFDHGLIDKPVRYGTGFSPPPRRTIRKALHRNGPRMFEPNELRAILDAADVPMRAMVLLAVNSGMGNQDIGMLPLAAVNLQTGWVDFPREKTATERRFPLWPETIEAIQDSLAKRPEPKPGHERYVFLTRKRQCWSKEDTAGTLSREFVKLLKRTGTYRPGLGFYSLRRTFQAIGEEAGETATRCIMGHVDDSMSARYRQRLSDDRLRAVTDRVRRWLFNRGAPRTVT